MGTNEKQAKQNVEILNGYHVPKWSGKPPSGLHLDVMKDGKMIQKLMIDEKKCYFFGRNKDVCDFVIDHASCSRVHAVLLWHKDLNRSFIVDLNSTHGTFIGSLRLEGNKPQQVFVDSELKFGASTRSYIVREKPQLNKHAVNPSAILNNSSANNSIVDVLNESGTGLDKEDSFSLLTSLPESEVELDNLTEFNTAHNKRIAQLVEMTSASSISNPLPNLVKQKRKCVSFNEDEEVINPEDIDPTIGRFRNLIQTTIVIPNKRKKLDSGGSASVTMPHAVDITRKPMTSRLSLYDEEEEEEDNRHKDDFESRFGLSSSVFSNLGVRALDIAPDVDEDDNEDHHRHQAAAEAESHHAIYQIHDVDQSGKKKYAKEAWPGRHPHAQLPSSSTVSASLISTAPETTAPTVAFNTTSSTLGAKRLAI